MNLGSIKSQQVHVILISGHTSKWASNSFSLLRFLRPQPPGQASENKGLFSMSSYTGLAIWISACLFLSYSERSTNRKGVLRHWGQYLPSFCSFHLIAQSRQFIISQDWHFLGFTAGSHRQILHSK